MPRWTDQGEAADEIDRLLQIVGRLPQDADGNPICLQDVLYTETGTEVRVWNIGVEFVTSSEGRHYEPGTLHRTLEAVKKVGTP